jgi:hypothetical protein
MKIQKNNILLAIQSNISLSYKQVNELYAITKSYDAIMDLYNISCCYNVDIFELAYFLYGHMK